MKQQKRHISTEKKLIAGIAIAILVLVPLLYLYHNYWIGVYIVDNIPTSFVGVGIIFVISLTILTIFVLGAALLGIHFPAQSESEKQIKNLSHDFINVRFKDFDNIPLSKFVSKNDIFWIAKMDDEGKVSYIFHFNSNFYQTESYEVLLKHFNI